VLRSVTATPCAFGDSAVRPTLCNPIEELLECAIWRSVRLADLEATPVRRLAERSRSRLGQWNMHEVSVYRRCFTCRCHVPAPRLSRARESNVAAWLFSVERERESFIFHNTAKHKRNNITITTAAWRVARKANQPITASNPLSYTPITIYKTKRCKHVELAAATIIKPHRMHAMRKMRRVATDVTRSVVCLSVCWLVGHTNTLCKKRLNRPRCRLVADFSGPEEPSITWGRDQWYFD